MELARETSITPEQASRALAASGTTLKESERIATVAKRPGVALGALLAAVGAAGAVPPEAVLAAEIEIKYDGYLARERDAAERLAELASFALPSDRSEEHTSELQSRLHLVCRLLLEKKKKQHA